MRLKSIVINNLYSFGEGVLCTFPQEDYTKVLIIGVNNDEAGADSNGAGKSAVLNCIFWALFGEIFQNKENTDEIIRKGQKSGSATLTLANDDGSDIVIARGRGTKKFLKLTIDGQDKSCNTDSQTQTELLKHLSISPSLKPAEYINDFLNTCYFSSDTAKGFMAKETTSSQRFALVERYLGLKRYTMASDMAKEKRKEIMAQIGDSLSDIAAKESFLSANTEEKVSAEIAVSEAEVKTVAAAIEQAQKVVEASKERAQLQQQLNTVTENLNQFRTATVRELEGLNQQYQALLATAEERKKELAEWQTLDQKVAQETVLAQKLLIEQKTHDAQANQINTHILELTSEIGVLNSEIKSLQSQLTTNYKCPQCMASLMLKDNTLHPVDVTGLANKLAGEEKNKSRILATIQDYRAQLTKLQDIVGTNNTTLQAYAYNVQTLGSKKTEAVLQSEIDGATKQATLVAERHAKIGAEAQDKVGVWKEGIKNLEEKLKTIPDTGAEVQKAQADIDQLNTKKDELNQHIGTKQQELKQIRATTQELWDIQKQTAEFKAKADIYGFWETGFKEIKVNIIDEFLPDFEDKVNDFLKRLKVNMAVDFGTQKQRAHVTQKDLAEGRAFKEEFNVDVYKNEELLPFGMLSKGQRGRIGSCVGMALRELTKERGSNRFDFFFMDEIADSLDESGLRELVSLLDETPAQKLVISHNDGLKNYFETITTVEMTNGVSTIHNN